MSRVNVSELMRASIRVRGIPLGRSVDAILDRGRRRVLGLEVHCGDAERRFLPFSVATLGARDLQIRSPLVLLEEQQLAFYKERGTTFRALRGLAVARRGKLLGTLKDLVLGDEGAIAEVVVATAAGARRVPYDDRTELGAPPDVT